MKLDAIYLPKANVPEVEAMDGIKIFPVANLKILALHLLKQKKIEPIRAKRLKIGESAAPIVDFSQIVGHEAVKRALLIAAAGGHNIMMYGPPGTGKSMLAKSLPGIMPDLSIDEALDVMHINSLCGDFSSNLNNISRPIRSPHHSASMVSVVGGGNSPRPGEITRAHHGVLLLDEFPEFPKSVVEALRQPIEDGQVTIARASTTLTMPANFMLVATANPCPCGYLGDKSKSCSCHPNTVSKYQQKLSGPILDRIDILIRVDRLNELVAGSIAESNRPRLMESPKVKARVSATRELIKSTPSENFKISSVADNIFGLCVRKMDLSPRSQTRLMRLARTIAALEQRTIVMPPDILEAAQYIDKTGWR